MKTIPTNERSTCILVERTMAGLCGNQSGKMLTHGFSLIRTDFTIRTDFKHLDLDLQMNRARSLMVLRDLKPVNNIGFESLSRVLTI